MPTTLHFDSRGRITVPAALREDMTDTVVAIKTPHGLVLHPIPEHVDIDADASDVTGEDLAASEA